jgi:hypothetical protein
MKEVDWESPDGHKYRVMCPEHDLDHPERGIVIGPPDLSALGLPFEVELRLHNQLWARQLFTAQDFDRRRVEAIGALQAALSVDVERVFQEYVKAAPKPPETKTTQEAVRNGGIAVSTSDGVRVARQQVQEARQRAMVNRQHQRNELERNQL